MGARARVRACVRACVRVCVCVISPAQVTKSVLSPMPDIEVVLDREMGARLLFFMLLKSANLCDLYYWKRGSASYIVRE